MTQLRALLFDRRSLALALVVMALFIKALVPAGYMIGQRSMTLSVEICADGTGQTGIRQIDIPLEGLAVPAADHSKQNGHCAFSSLGHDAVSGADPLLIAGALLFILTRGFAAIVQAPRQRVAYLRPPLRGPPARI
jgi:hypothetical protein